MKIHNHNQFSWLLTWFYTHCHSAWKPSYGLFFGTLDNPGWSLTVNIGQTLLQSKPFQEVEINRTDDDWLFCRIEKEAFKGYGGPFNLMEAINTFRDWTEEGNSIESFKMSIDDDFQWLMIWRQSQCDGNWEHHHGVSIRTSAKGDWYFQVSLDETELQDIVFEPIDVKRTLDDWVSCKVYSRRFYGEGGPSTLPEIFRIFCDWARESR